MQPKKIQIFTDGSCLGNPGPGGLGAILRYQQHEKHLSEGYFLTTNNRMELLAVIKALEALNQHCEIDLYSDSQYMKNGITTWIHSWKASNWKKGKIKNQDLWKRLDAAVARHSINWHWVKGHSGHVENEICDELARRGAMNPTQADTGYVAS